MNKVKLETKHIRISLSSTKESIDSLVESASLLYNHCCGHQETPSMVFTKETTEEHTEEVQEPIVSSVSEFPAIRKRLPNNVVDIKDLTVKQAIRESALVRCPKCGQAHCLAVSGGSRVYMMERQFSSNEFGIIAEFDSLGSQDFVNMCCKEDTDKQLYYKDLQALKPLDDKDFAVNNDTEIFCPVCHESNTFETWKDAFENPLNYFETEHLCDACGGEKLEKLIKKKKVYACDSCGLVSDFKEEN